jgi:iron complex outermembrane receptor protein
VLEAQELSLSGPSVQLAESLNRLPGVWVADRGNAAQDLQLSVRGFGARASFGIRGIRVLLDGFPASAPDGSGSVSGAALGLAERVELLRGPFSALHGTHSGGTLSIQTRAPRGGAFQARSDLWLASPGARQLSAHMQGGPAEAPWQAWVSNWQTRGWRPHAQAERTQVHARWDPAPGWQVLAQAQSQPAQDPLGLSRAQWESTPDGVAEEALRFNTRKQLEHQMLGLKAASGAWTGRVWLQHRDVWQWQATAVAAQLAPTHPGGVIALERWQPGLSVQWEGSNWVFGGQVESQFEHRRGFENFIGPPASAQTGVTGRLRRDETQALNRLEAWAQGQQALADGLALHAGLRLGLQHVRSTDAYLANGNDSGGQRRSLALPTVGFSGPVSAQGHWFWSLGAARETPTLNEMAYRADGSAGLNTELRPQQAVQTEWGWRQAGPASAQAPSLQWLEATVFAAQTRDEIVSTRQSGGRAAFANVGQTRRLGLETSGRALLPHGLRADWAYTWLRAKVSEGYAVCERAPCPAASAWVPAGATLPGAPAHSTRVDLAHAARPTGPGAGPSFKGHAWGVTLLARSRVWVNDRNTDAAPGHALLGAWLQWQLRPSDSLTLRLENALARRHIAGVIVNESNGRTFEPGPGRTWSLQWRHAFGAGAVHPSSAP